MKHASEQSLHQLETVLEKIRQRPELTEKKRGIFYRRCVAFLHFHEDGKGLFADIKVDGDWQRLAVNTATERRELLTAVHSALE